MFDLVIRGGTIADGTGRAVFTGDVAIKDGRIAEVGTVTGQSAREIDAGGLLVCPGFIDTHTHFDGQVTWDPHLAPSSWHGVTTVIMGNCGVGFAPVRPGQKEYLIDIMEGVEDIPGSALAEGMPWDWETFPEYLDSLDRLPRSIDVATQVPHCAIRAYVMGRDRALDDETTPEDIAQMAAITREAIEAGAVGFSTSRTFLHFSHSGELIPGTHSNPRELVGIARGMAEGGSGVFQMISDSLGKEPDRQWMKQIGQITGRPFIFSMVDVRADADPFEFRDTLEALEQVYQTEGVDIRAAVPWRPPGFLMGLQTSLHPFTHHAVFAEIADLPLEQKVARMRAPEFRAALLADAPDMKKSLTGLVTRFDKMFPLGAQPDYEPRLEDSIAGRAAAAGVSPSEYAYDALLENDGRNFIFVPVAGYTQGNFDILHEMLSHPRSTASLSDAGAHVPSVCDASFTTYMLTHWVKGRTRGARLGLEEVIRKQTSEPADIYAFHDRGAIEVGRKADINIIDLDALELHAPYTAFDLPLGGARVLQKVDGFRYTLVNGEIIAQDGEMTDARPGKLVRGPQSRTASPIERDVVEAVG
ncbi:N-acyl-D-amino-acid deacylase family protein [Sphingomonas solaris]|uniref:Amidohydrolase family protein n=1 Tax=Alterirhizorhabdus solaris TaxID=2529389 RepID=A0A558RBY3_9SPHN|nr:amidohydrolase family protein [Sphingomonas solaris]TVV76772.1 amidohydrolase family protein [Sphingomonas solaris]